MKSHKGLKKLQVTYIKDVSVYSEIQIIVDETSRGIYTADLMPSVAHTEELRSDRF